MPPIYFYISAESNPTIDWPQTIDEYWKWLQAKRIQCPGEQSWILQNYLYLKAEDFPVALSLLHRKKALSLLTKFPCKISNMFLILKPYWSMLGQIKIRTASLSFMSLKI